MYHTNTKLTFHSRKKMISDYQSGKPVKRIAKELGISRKCFYYWRVRYNQFDELGLKNRSTRPNSSPNKISLKLEQNILNLRKKERIGPQRIAIKFDLSSSTVYKVLKRNGCNLLREKERRKIVRYEKSYPGELVHIDVKRLPAVSGNKKWEFQFSAVDDYSREAFSLIFDKETTSNATLFLEEALRAFSYPIRAVLTDNSLAFTMKRAYNYKGETKFAKTLKRCQIKHRLTRPKRPETNGKVERFHRTVDEELYHLINFQSTIERKKALERYVKKYNEQRIHLGIGGLTPKQRRDQYFMPKKCYQCA